MNTDLKLIFFTLTNSEDDSLKVNPSESEVWKQRTWRLSGYVLDR